MNPAHTTYFPDQPGDVIACCASQAAGAQTQAMMCVIIQREESVYCSFVGNNPGYVENRPRRIIRLQAHIYIALDGYRHDFIDKVL